MSKEYLEALEWLETKCYVENPQEETFEECVNIIKQSLQRLESIDNANPSEALNITNSYLKVFEKENADVLYNIESFKQDFNTIKQALIKAQEQEKVLSVLKEKNVDIEYLGKCNNVKEYNAHWCYEKFYLTEEEFNLLKRWLG